MKKLVVGLGLLLALALPARADSGPYFVILTSATSSAVVNSTAPYNLQANPVKNYSLQVRGSTGTVTSWTVALEVSIDGINFSPVVSHATADGDGVIKTSTAYPGGFPATWMRIRTAAISTSAVKTLVITAIGSQ